MSPLIENVEQNDDDAAVSISYVQTLRSKLDTLLLDLSPVDWNAVTHLLECLNYHRPTFGYAKDAFTSPENDPLGRLFLTRLISRNPPLSILDMAMSRFPEALKCNPAAFFTASRDASVEVSERILQYVVKDIGKEDECPYPFLFSEHISTETAKVLLEGFPCGVWMTSPSLNFFNLLDYFLMAPCMVDQTVFDLTLWKKFKMVLVAAQHCAAKKSCACNVSCACRVAPVQVILKRVLSRSDAWDNPKRAKHILWLLHQLRWTDQWVFEKCDERGAYPIHVVLAHKCVTHPTGLLAARELTKILLEAYPPAAARSFHGKRALHMAVENGWPCHDLLLCIDPGALDTPDPNTHLFPFQAAAKTNLASHTSLSLDMTYELLRANPIHARSIGKEGTSVQAHA